MKDRIAPLPHWVLTDLQPAFYDTESVTCIEMVAKLYKKIEELIGDYNYYVDEINKYIKDFEDGIIKDFNELKCCIIKTMNQYIETIDMKINLQDTTIQTKIDEIDTTLNNQNEQIENQNQIISDANDYLRENLTTTVTNLINYYFDQGLITTDVSVSYDPTNEEMQIIDNMYKAEDGEY